MISQFLRGGKVQEHSDNIYGMIIFIPPPPIHSPLPAFAHKFNDRYKCSGTIFQTEHVALPKINFSSKNTIYAT
jgi:hypothetical protein